MNKNQFVLSQKNMWYVNQFPQRNNRRGCGVAQVGLRIPLVGPTFGPLPWALSVRQDLLGKPNTEADRDHHGLKQLRLRFFMTDEFYKEDAVTS